MSHKKPQFTSLLVIVIISSLMPYTCAFGQGGWYIHENLGDLTPGKITLGSSGHVWIGYYESPGPGIVDYDGTDAILYPATLWGQTAGEVYTPKVSPLTGDLWLGTSIGLVHFDGTEWILYDTTNSDLPNPHVFSLAIEESGALWMTTWSENSMNTPTSDLSHFDGSEWTVYDTSNSSIKPGTIGLLCIDNENTIWVGYLEGYKGLVSHSDSGWTFYDSSNSGFPATGVSYMAANSNGDLWVVNYEWGGIIWEHTYYGLTHFDGIDWTWYNYDNSDFPWGSVQALAVEESGKVWVGFESYEDTCGLVSFDGMNWTIYTTANSELPIGISK